jgi:hypothetical protein
MAPNVRSSRLFAIYHANDPLTSLPTRDGTLK